MAVSTPSIRFYKFVTGPKGDGATVSIGGKQVAGASFASTLSAINSLGATVNSIGVALKRQQAATQAAHAEAARNAQLNRDRNLEGKIEAPKENIGQKIGGVIAAASPTFMDWLGKLLKSMLMYGVLDWLSDPKNRESIERTFKRLKSFFEGIVAFFTRVSDFITTNWEKAFGKDKTFQERMEGALKLIGAGAAVLVGLAFLKNPIKTITTFGKMLTGVAKGIFNLGKFLGGNVIGQTLLAAGQGIMAYQDVMANYEGDEEDRRSAAIGAGTGAAVGGMALGALGNKIAGPLGGLIGNAVGGFLGKHAGKFLGPIVKDTFNALKEFFDKVMKVVNAFLEPIKKATKEFFEALGPAIQKLVDFIEPHLPKIMEIASFLGETAFKPLIMLMQGLTQVLKWVAGTKAEKTTTTTAADVTSSDPGTIPQEHIDMVDLESAGGPFKAVSSARKFSKGGIFNPETVLQSVHVPQRSIGGSVYNIKPRFAAPQITKVQEMAKGGWIHGPQSGYPVSLDGGRSVSFIGHGTEYVAQRSAGGFVIPFDTPDTRRDPGLTSRRLSEAQAGGYLKSIGGLIPKTALGLLGGGPGGAAFGGLINSFMGSVTERIGQRMSTAIPTPTLQTSSPKTGEDLASILARIKNLSTAAQNGDFENAVKTMVAEAIKLPVEQQGGGGMQMPIPLPAKENPATSFLASRFGRVAEQSNIFSNFI